MAAFIIAMVLAVLALRLGLQPFLSLVMASLAFGLLAGLGAGTLVHINDGLGAIFSGLALVILAGAIIAEHLRKGGAMGRVVEDLLLISGRRGLAASAISGYLVSIPVMCCITSYMVLEPAVALLDRRARRMRFMLAVAAASSFVFVYPSPVVAAAASTLGVSAQEAFQIGLPISLLSLAVGFIVLSLLPVREDPVATVQPGPPISRLAAWSPLLLPLVLILAGAWSDQEVAQIAGQPGLALLAGAMLSLGLARRRLGKAVVGDMLHSATRRSGVILLDLCGAGAFGAVAGSSGLPAALQSALSFLPDLASPFLVAGLLQLALGSRVVTAVMAARLFSGSPVEPALLLLAVCCGTLTFSWVTDPFFWLVRDTSESTVKETMLGYTLPLTLAGTLGFAALYVRAVFLQ